MAWRRHTEPPRVEPPLWYRAYDPAAWDQPDRHEQAMIDGSRGYGEWPAELHQIHGRRRWQEAKYAYRQQNPALAEQEFGDIVRARH
jgi:hypothetical protein